MAVVPAKAPNIAPAEVPVKMEVMQWLRQEGQQANDL